MKAALLGGTFDPVHNGHLYIAGEAIRILGLDQVRFQVSGIPPHKLKAPVTDARHRLNMVSLAVAGESRFIASDAELRRGGVSYTIDSLDEAAQELGADNICFIAGSDVLRDIHEWKKSTRLLEEFSFLFIQRPGEKVDLGKISLAPDLRARVLRAGDQASPEIKPGTSWLVTLDPPRISSSELREMIAGRKPGLERLLPGNVLKYALENHLYESKYGNN